MPEERGGLGVRGCRLLTSMLIRDCLQPNVQDGTISIWEHSRLEQNGFGWFDCTTVIKVNLTMEELRLGQDGKIVVYDGAIGDSKWGAEPEDSVLESVGVFKEVRIYLLLGFTRHPEAIVTPPPKSGGQRSIPPSHPIPIDMLACARDAGRAAATMAVYTHGRRGRAGEGEAHDPNSLIADPLFERTCWKYAGTPDK